MQVAAHGEVLRGVIAGDVDTGFNHAAIEYGQHAVAIVETGFGNAGRFGQVQRISGAKAGNGAQKAGGVGDIGHRVGAEEINGLGRCR